MNKPSGAWQRKFLAALAETSNVAAAARKAGISASAAYEARRKNRAFADSWQAALAEGYDNLEIELLRRLREGELKPAAGARRGVRSYDNGIALRLLMAHREARAKQEAVRANVSAAEVRAAIDRKLAAIKKQVLAEEERRTALDDE
ncbi:MAG TPA: hypothetical protein VL100_02495 [Croceibacterium sp.]|nr:hypothetical protein [Croceibacterium sp.]